MLGVVLVAGGVIVTQFLRSAVDYYCNVDEIGVRSGCDADRRLRVQGIVEPARCRRSTASPTFTITFNGVTVPVRYDGSRAGSSRSASRSSCTVASSGDTFTGDDVEVKHDSELRGGEPERIALAEADAPATCPADGG